MKKLRVGSFALVSGLALAGCAPPAPEASAAAERVGAPVVRVGLERLTEGELLIEGPADGRNPVGAAEHLAGKRLGLVVHAASVTAGGRHAIDVVSEQGLEVVRLFSPEHGLRGRAAAGEKVDSGRDPASGLPVVSLYGENRQPQPAELADLDALVFDLQGAGVRFYTYVSTLILVLEAAAENGVELIVLDRPNPLGGQRVAGPVSAPRDVVPASFVNLAPGPLVHGLTLGEMARVVNRGREKPARLSVVAMTGWSRDMAWTDTGRPWVAPSPNLRSPEAALVYPGVALLEATNVSEGRGTAEPFLFFGAPWLAGVELAVATPGVVLEPTRFTPTASPAAPWAKYLDQECHGWGVRILDPEAVEPYRLGVSVLRALAAVPGFEWRREGAALTWLVGTPDLHAALEQGRSVADILAADAADHRAWRQRIAEHLIYRP